ncbi:MAG: hypothetical protein MMC33_009718 [Icmadophila ericetorum]|nr:hypothetical protein [Icmadophila ericetorum]
MSTFKQESMAPSPMAQSSTCFDDPLSDFINFDQDSTYSSPPGSQSSSSFSRGKAIESPQLISSRTNNSILASQSNSQQLFSGPSHQYDSYPQQTGLPFAGLQNTLAANQPNLFSYNGIPSFGAPPSDGYFGLNTGDEMFDFNSLPSHNPSFSSSVDTDMDFDSPTPDLFKTESSIASVMTDFVDPNAIGGREDTSASSTPVQATVNRVWPGMHQQQAALAKAQAARKQQQQQHRQMQVPQIVAPRQSQSAHRPTGGVSRPAPDPVVEERISRLLSQMRQNSEASSTKEDANNASSNAAMTHLARQRKDEEEMDEDERLLASEEGKKLSSKERRQLRNKVSARAFRSRRKEYIGQLEGEIATKTKEADDLRTENEALKSENTRLTDLTRMLLSSSAFSSFLNELSSNVPASTNASTAHSAPAIQQRTRVRQRKDVNPNQHIQSQNNLHAGMVLMPDTVMDFSTFQPTDNAWNIGMDFGFNNAQVFSVTEVPGGPAVDTPDFSLLSGKSPDAAEITFSSEDTKDDAPVIERMPLSSEKCGVIILEHFSDEEDFDESDPVFALYADQPASKAVSIEEEYQVFGEIELEKAVARIDLYVYDGIDVSAVAMARFERICSSLDTAGARIESITGHL